MFLWELLERIKKMRCKICDKNLTTVESTTKCSHTGEFLDTCGECNSDIYATLSEFEYEIKNIGIDSKQDKV